MSRINDYIRHVYHKEPESMSADEYVGSVEIAYDSIALVVGWCAELVRNRDIGGVEDDIRNICKNAHL
jgi:hypothetical protein